jgi:hypothetical protein
MTTALLADTLDYLALKIDSMSSLADELRALAVEVEESSVQDYHPRGTILKAQADQFRFKPKSMWVSLGDGKYLHLNGKKGLVTTHDRLDGYTDVIFSA